MPILGCGLNTANGQHRAFPQNRRSRQPNKLESTLLYIRNKPVKRVCPAGIMAQTPQAQDRACP
jgi:hypothetical protein